MATRVRDGRLLRILTGAIAIAWSGGWGAFGFAQADGDANGFLPAAEERLEQGETAAAFAAYRAEFDAANSISGRLGRIGSLARVALVNGGLVSFFEDLPGQEWEQALLRAAIRQFLEDLPGALSEVAEIEASGVPAEIRLLGISFFIPSAPFPPKARGRRGFDSVEGALSVI